MTTGAVSRSALSLRTRGGAPPSPQGRAGALWHHLDGRVRGQAYVDSHERWLQWEEAGLFRFRPNSHDVDVWPRPNVRSATVLNTFNHEIQPLILQSLGFETLHGASAGGPEGGLAFCGRSGGGKSTLAYALGRLGWTHLSDDHVILDFDQPRPRLRSVPFTPRLRPLSAQHFGHPEPTLTSPTGVRDWRPLLAIVIVEQMPDLATWIAIGALSAAEALPELLPHAHAFDPHDLQESSRLAKHYAALVDAVPIYRLQYRPSFSRLETMVREVQRLARQLARPR